MSSVLGPFLDLITQGGLVMVPLVIVTFVLWYTVGYRAFQLRRKGLLERARDVASRAAAQTLPQLRLEAAFGPFEARIQRGSVLARSLVVIAPLLGLLGTVTGMIELFDSLGTQTFNSQDGGIAKGIAEALFTTQLGLAIAIPGFFITRLLDRRESSLRDELGRIKCAATGVSR